jgi:hypothetical protein
MTLAVTEAENAIDAAFQASPLLSLTYNQAAWTVLAVNEDLFLKDHNTRPHEEMHAVVDTTQPPRRLESGHENLRIAIFSGLEYQVGTRLVAQTRVGRGPCCLANCPAGRLSLR